MEKQTTISVTVKITRGHENGEKRISTSIQPHREVGSQFWNRRGKFRLMLIFTLTCQQYPSASHSFRQPTFSNLLTISSLQLFN